MTGSSEAARLAALRALDALDVDADERFELMAHAAQQMFDVPMVSITLVDADREWRVAFRGPLTHEAAREGSICPVAMYSPTTFVIEDIALDPQFGQSSWVIGEPHLRFYAGQPLHAPGGEPIGSFCLMDVRPRHLDRGQLEALADLGHWIQQELQAGVRPVGKPAPAA